MQYTGRTWTDLKPVCKTSAILFWRHNNIVRCVPKLQVYYKWILKVTACYNMYHMRSLSEQSNFFEQAITSILDSQVPPVQETTQSNDISLGFQMSSEI